MPESTLSPSQSIRDYKFGYCSFLFKYIMTTSTVYSLPRGYLLYVLPRSISLELASPITTLPAPNTDPKTHPIKFAIKIKFFYVIISSQVTLLFKGMGVPRLAAKMVSFRPNLRRIKIKKPEVGQEMLTFLLMLCLYREAFFTSHGTDTSNAKRYKK